MSSTAIATDTTGPEMLSFENFRQQVVADYTSALMSREVSLLGRREVLTGKAKFGIFGDGKEVAQVAMARYFRNGDFRSGYYRDQTFMFASGLATVESFFAQLYADTNPDNDTFSAGRQMNGHFATRFVDKEGNWLPLTQHKNVSSDIAPTAGQMVRGLGLAFASKVFRNVKELSDETALSHHGDEICFVTIGDASTSEGQFWETVNAAGVLQVPLAIFVWDDGYGISVPKKYQTTKGSISEVLSGFQQQPGTNGLDIYRVKGWDYAGMCEVFEQGLEKIRRTHTPAIFHVEELTQPQGHSTSGSHERYKDADRLAWEKEWDGLAQMKQFLLNNHLASEDELEIIAGDVKEQVREAKSRAWTNYLNPIKADVDRAADLLTGDDATSDLGRELKAIKEPLRRDALRSLKTAIDKQPGNVSVLKQFYAELKAKGIKAYNTTLYNEGPKSALKVAASKAGYDSNPQQLNGFEVLNKYWDELFAANPKVVAFGEDLGHIGDVNQGFSGLQEKYGIDRIFDTGIRELTIMGQGIGLAMRGLRPIAEIQYLDYLLYGLQPLSDDVATLHYRSAGQQSCPLIVRTRGHRLEGIWHSGSPMGMIIHSLRGMHVCVPRNMTQAVGFYNTLLASNDPGLVVECLNGYRLKENLPNNLLDYRLALGVPDVLLSGEDITIVSYGSTLRIVMDAAERLAAKGIDVEVVDVQTLLPFDVNHLILESLKKTSRILFVDEDVPGGAAAYMFQQVMEVQQGYRYLDVAPRTLSAKAHRPAYGSDGDYFSKPNAEEVMETVEAMMAE